MSSDCAEVAASETSPVRIDGILNHVICRYPLALVSRMRQFGKRQVPEGIHIFLTGRRIRGINLHIAITAAFDDGIRMHHIGQSLNMMKILGKSAFVPLALLERMEFKHALPHLRLSAHIESQLRNLMHIVKTSSCLDTLCKLQHRLLPHSIAEIISPARHENGRHETVIPVIVMRQSAE